MWTSQNIIIMVSRAVRRGDRSCVHGTAETLSVLEGLRGLVGGTVMSPPFACSCNTYLYIASEYRCTVHNIIHVYNMASLWYQVLTLFVWCSQEAESAIAAMNGQWLGSRSIRTNWATRKPPTLKTDCEYTVNSIYYILLLLNFILLWLYWFATSRRFFKIKFSYRTNATCRH